MSSSDDDNIQACFTCGSTRFHTENGLQYCERGHLQSLSQVIGQDEDDFGNQGRRNRAAREKVARKKVAKVYHGKEAFELFLQAYQFILWTQCHDLIVKKGIPSDLWTIVHSLWTLRLSKLAITPSDTDTDGISTDAVSEETDGASTDYDKAGPSARKSRVKAIPKLVETIALCYLGTLILKLPIGLGQFFRWIEHGQIAYFRAIRLVPFEMRQKMSGGYQSALDTKTQLDVDRLQQAVIRLAGIYMGDFGVTLPPLNVNLILYQYIKKLSVPLEVFPATKSLAQLLGYIFTFPVVKHRQQVKLHPEAQLISTLVVSLKLLYPFDSQTVVRHPYTLAEPAAQKFDWTTWFSAFRIGSDPLDTSSARPSNQTGDPSSLLSTTAQDVFDMTSSELDRYMDWYQKTWARPEVEDSESASKEIFDMFPLLSIRSQDILSGDTASTERESDPDIKQRLKATHQAIETQPVVPEENTSETDGNILRPGDQYHLSRTLPQRSSTNKVGGEEKPHPSPAREEIERAVLLAAADMAGMSLNSILLAVKQTERKVTVWLEAKRRREYWNRIDQSGVQEISKGEQEEEDEDEE